MTDSRLVEDAARTFGVPLGVVRRALLPSDTRARLAHIEAKAEEARWGALLSRDAAAELQRALAQVHRLRNERRLDYRHTADEMQAADALIALLESEAGAATAACEAADRRVQDVLRVRESVLKHLGLLGDSAIREVA